MLYPTGLSGLKLLSESDYQNLDPPIENTLYIVQKDNGSFSLYLGSAALFIALTQEEYDALDNPADGTFYVIIDSA